MLKSFAWALRFMYEVRSGFGGFPGWCEEHGLNPKDYQRPQDNDRAEHAQALRLVWREEFSYLGSPTTQMNHVIRVLQLDAVFRAEIEGAGRDPDASPPGEDYLLDLVDRCEGTYAGLEKLLKKTAPGKAPLVNPGSKRKSKGDGIDEEPDEGPEDEPDENPPAPAPDSSPGPDAKPRPEPSPAQPVPGAYDPRVATVIFSANERVEVVNSDAPDSGEPAQVGLLAPDFQSKLAAGEPFVIVPKSGEPVMFFASRGNYKPALRKAGR